MWIGDRMLSFRVNPYQKGRTMNFELIATEIGDYVKYTTTINEINRVAKPIFKFPLQEFPNESITSTRAQLIYDWILSLEDYDCSPGEKEELLIAFATRLHPRLLELLRDLGVGIVDEDIHEEELKRFDAYKFHPAINTHCRKLYGQGNYFHAVFEAAKLYNSLVKSKARSTDDGQDLMMKAWDPNKGALKITLSSSETDTNFQDGVKFLSAGLMRAVRNPTAHEPALDWPIDEQDATDILSLVSFLLRQHDKARYSP